MTLTSNPPGIPDAPRLSGWIGESLGGEPAELAGIQLIAGGRSNGSSCSGDAGPCPGRASQQPGDLGRDRGG